MEANTQHSIARAIEVQRIRSGISSQAELARRAGIDPQALYRRMTGDLRMTLADIERLAVALNIDPFDLFDLAKSERAIAGKVPA